MVDYLPMNAADGEIPITAATRHGVSQIKLLDPYAENSAGFISKPVFVAYCSGRAGFHAHSAADTLGMVGAFCDVNVHLAGFCAGAA